MSSASVTPAPALPHWLVAPLGLLPRTPADLAAVALLNRVFAPVLASGDLDFLEGRQIALKVEDLGHTLVLTVARRRLLAGSSASSPDACISARAYDFLQLAAGAADPDTLFFQRRITLSGDTDLSLGLKNLLAALDPQELVPRPAHQALCRVAGWLRARLEPPAPSR